MPDTHRDHSGRPFLLAYIDLLKSEKASLQQQLDRYAEDFRALLAADDAPARFRAARPLPEPPKPRRYSLAYIAAVSGLCQQIAERLGQSTEYHTTLAEAVRTALTAHRSDRHAASEAVQQMALEIALFCGPGATPGASGSDLPLASRIFALAEYAASLTEALYPDQEVAPLAHGELAELLRHESDRLFDRELVDVLLQLIAEREGSKR